jgi:hypothetical protein
MVQIDGYKCRRCDHTWVPRGASSRDLREPKVCPTVCPKCKSPYWNKAKREAKRAVEAGVGIVSGETAATLVPTDVASNPGDAVDVTISLHPAAFARVQELRARGLDGTTDALVCTGFVLEALRRRFSPATDEATAEATDEPDRGQTVDERSRQPRIGMTYEEVMALDVGPCAHEGESGPEAFACACDACQITGSLVCTCGVLYVDHESGTEFSLASWKAVPGVEPPPAAPPSLAPKGRR